MKPLSRLGGGARRLLPLALAMVNGVDGKSGVVNDNIRDLLIEFTSAAAATTFALLLLLLGGSDT